MATEALRNIKVYCHEHGRVFPTPAKAQILCGVSKHNLAGDFPHGEVWEYCCDCETFFPSKLGHGETARKDCPVCGRQVVRRYLCGKCSTLSFESDEPPEGKNAANIDYEKGIRPFCQACLASTGGAAVQIHECEKTAADFVTPRENCLFCKKIIVFEPVEEPVLIPAVEEPKKEAAPTRTIGKGFINCPNPACKKEIPEKSTFCGFCGMVLSPNSEVEDSKTRFQAKTLLFNSFCPKCNAPSSPEDKFCKECGQALKSLAVAEPKAPPVVAPVAPGVVTNASDTADKQISAIKQTGGNSALGIVGCGGLLLFIVLLVFIFSKNSATSGNNANVNLAYNNSNYGSSSTNSNNSNSASTVNTTNTYTANANKPASTATPSSTTNSSSSRSFNRTYAGKINYTNDIEMRLERDGDTLSGKVIPLNRYSTSITVSGTIDDDNSFEMYEYDDQDNITGLYQGTIYSSGRIEGTWSKPDGSAQRPFYLALK
jgi:ribosomal protein S27AE